MVYVDHGVPQVQFSDLCFFIYINNLIENFDQTQNIFADISFSMTINDPSATAKQLCQGLDKIKEWAFQ